MVELMTIDSHYLTNILVRLDPLRHVRAMEQNCCLVTGFWGVLSVTPSKEKTFRHIEGGSRWFIGYNLLGTLFTIGTHTYMG